jgi:hypothetical protein
MATNYPAADTTGYITNPSATNTQWQGTEMPDTLHPNNPNRQQNLIDTVVALSGGVTSSVVGTPGAINALGVKTTAGTLKYGFNSVTLTTSDALTLTLPAVAVGAFCFVVTTQCAASTAGTVVWTPTTLDAGGTDYAVTATNSAVDIFGFISDGVSWYSFFSSKAVS